MISATSASPVAAQSRDASRRLTHVVSVSVPARVKVNVSPIAAMSRSIPAAVSLRQVSNDLAVTVDANRPWVLAVSPATGSPKSRSPLVLTVTAP